MFLALELLASMGYGPWGVGFPWPGAAGIHPETFLSSNHICSCCSAAFSSVPPPPDGYWGIWNHVVRLNLDELIPGNDVFLSNDKMQDDVSTSPACEDTLTFNAVLDFFASKDKDTGHGEVFKQEFKAEITDTENAADTQKFDVQFIDSEISTDKQNDIEESLRALTALVHSSQEQCKT